MATQKPKAEQEAALAAIENNDCFIIMPIADHADYKAGHFKRVYQDIFAPACKAAGYNPVRADDVAQTNLIQLDILQKLLESPMAICDLSTRNPNVLFELGLRQAFDKPTILVQEVGTPAIFDISMFRYTTYNKALDYREVLSDQQNIQRVLEETKNAVNDGKNVNSIVKLLSISQPAKLEDASKFGEKEYFDVLMGEIRDLKNQINKPKQPILNKMGINNTLITYTIFLSRLASANELGIIKENLRNLPVIIDTLYQDHFSAESIVEENTTTLRFYLNIRAFEELEKSELYDAVNIPRFKGLQALAVSSGP